MLLVSNNRPIGVPAFSAVSALMCFAALGLVACSATDTPGGGAAGSSSTAAGSSNASGGSTPGAAGNPGVVNTAGQGTASGGSGSGGAPPIGGGGAAQGGGDPQGGAAQGGAAQGGQAGAAHVRDHCVDGYEPDPSDATMVDGPVEFTVQSQIDLTVQPAVLDWFKARVWEQAHFQ